MKIYFFIAPMRGIKIVGELLSDEKMAKKIGKK